IAFAFADLRSWYFPEKLRTAYRAVPRLKRFFLAAIPLTLITAVGFTSAHLGDGLFERPDRSIYGLLGAGVGGVAAVPFRQISLWWFGKAATDAQQTT